MESLLPLLLLFFFLFLQNHSVCSMSKMGSFSYVTDRESLLSFKFKVADPRNALSGWTQNSSHCTWYGVSCTTVDGARVRALRLSGLGLFGDLPPALSNLTFLRVLDLSNNSFQGQILLDFGRFLHIEHIKLASNSIDGPIPVGLSHCQNLKTINLASNNLIGNLPQELGHLPGLKILDLSVNTLTGAIPPSFGNLSSLTDLALARNHFFGKIPSELGRLRNLTRLELSDNYFSGSFPYSIFNISSLTYLSVTKNNLSGKLPIDIGIALPNLVGFYLALNNFEGMIPTSISNASQIQFLDFSFNGFQGPIPLFGNMNNLAILNLGNNSLSSNTKRNFQLTDSLRNSTQLKILRLFGNQLAGELPSSVANLSTHLTEFCVDSNMLTGSIPQGMENFPNLISLSIENNYFTGEIPKALGTLTRLQKLTLHQNKFYGEIPEIFANLSQLFVLTMGRNHFSGRTPSSIGNCQRLTILGLAANRLNGSIAKEIFGLSSLRTLYLPHNFLSGPLPSEVGNLKQLQFIDVSDNQLSGDLPISIGLCESLLAILMARNNITGSIPKSIGDLASLESLDLSSNSLSGSIPEELGELHLRNLNLSFNQLEGEVPANGIFRNLSWKSFRGNNRLCVSKKETAEKMGLPQCITKKRKRHLVIIISSVAGLIFLIGLICCCRRILKSQNKNNKRDHQITSSFPPSKGSPPMISYSDIQIATNNFAEGNLIGKGGFGSVFKGDFSTGENRILTLAVKVLDLKISKASQSFIAECHALRNVRHRNLVKVITSCSSIDHKGDDFRALVMEFMSSGNLDQWLYPKDAESGLCLTLLQRLNIAIDIASAMDYLHHDCDPPIVHRDLKPGNVLLDDDMAAHVGDFGLAKIISPNPLKQHSSTLGLKGSIGYIPPEYGLGGKASTSGDVYSFGILMLEMIMAKKPTDAMFQEGLSLDKFASETNENTVLQIVDARLFNYNQCSPESISTSYASTGNGSNSSINSNDFDSYWLHKGEECVALVIRLGLSCAAQSAKDRITMREALTKLHEIKKFLLSF